MNIKVTVNGGIQCDGLLIGKVQAIQTADTNGVFHARVGRPFFCAYGHDPQEAAETATGYLLDWWKNASRETQEPETPEAAAND
jgi:hypothetical protein